MDGWYPIADREIIYLPQIAICVVVGLYAIRAVAGDPRRFWPLLIVLTVATPGFMIHRFDFVDVFFAACLLFGACIRIVVRSDQVATRPADPLQRLHWFVFTLMTVYMLGEAARGMVELESLRKIRWVVFYAMLALLAVMLSLRYHVAPSLRRMAFLIGVSTACYFAVYILYGFLSEQFRGIGRYALQTAEWGSSAQVMFPVALTLPAAIVLVRDTRRLYALVGWCAIAVALAAAFYYDSRSGQLTVAAFLVVGAPLLGLKRVVLFVAVVVLTLLLFFQFVWPADEQRDLSYVFDDVFGSTAGVITPGTLTRDLDRIVYLRVGFESINKDWETFLFGYGFRSYSRVIGPYVSDLLRYYGSTREDIGTDPYNVGAEAFTALTVDSGVVGLLLLLANFGFVAFEILVKCRNRYRFIWLLSLMALFGWMMVIYILQFVMFYLVLMPHGLLVRLSEAPEGFVTTRSGATERVRRRLETCRTNRVGAAVG